MDRVEVLANYAYHSEWCGEADSENPTQRCPDQSCQEYRDRQAQWLDKALSETERSPEITLDLAPEELTALVLLRSGGRVEIPQSLLVAPPPLEVQTWIDPKTETIILASRVLDKESQTEVQPEGAQHGQQQ